MFLTPVLSGVSFGPFPLPAPVELGLLSGPLVAPAPVELGLLSGPLVAPAPVELGLLFGPLPVFPPFFEAFCSVTGFPFILLSAALVGGDFGPPPLFFA